MKKLAIILTILICSCVPQKEAIKSYTYFKVDSVRNDGLYEILVKDPSPCNDQLMLFPTGSGAIIPETYDRYLKIIYKSDSIWVKGDTLVLQKK